MDAQTADSELIGNEEGWFARERASGRLYRWATIAMAALLAVMLASRASTRCRMFSVMSCSAEVIRAAFYRPR